LIVILFALCYDVVFDVFDALFIYLLYYLYNLATYPYDGSIHREVRGHTHTHTKHTKHTHKAHTQSTHTHTHTRQGIMMNNHQTYQIQRHYLV